MQQTQKQHKQQDRAKSKILQIHKNTRMTAKTKTGQRSNNNNKKKT